MKLVWAEGSCQFAQVPFRRVFEPIRRPVPADAEMVTAYTDGQVTLRSNRSKVGYHEAADLSGYQGVAPGDFVVHGLDILRGSVGVSDAAGAISTVCTLCRPKIECDLRYFAYAMRAQATSGLPRALAKGVREGGADFRRWDTLAELPLPFPAPHTQRAIADHLDTECARIDALIAKKRRMIELLDEAFWRSVVRSVDEVSTKMAPIRRVLTRIADGPFGSSLTSAHYTDDGARVVRLGNIGLAEFKDTDQAFVSLDHYSALQRHRVQAGDLLIAGLGDSRNHVGRACVAPDLGRAIVKADCYCAGVDQSRALPEFLALFLSSPRGADQVAVASRGTTRSRINLDIAKEIKVPWIEVKDQQRIVSSAEARRHTARKAGALLERQANLLVERRGALITAAVTGGRRIEGSAQ